MITASIVLYHTPKHFLDRAVKSVLESSRITGLYLIDNSRQALFNHNPDREFDDPRVEYFFAGKNLGYGKGHNLILLNPQKRAKYHLVMNPDVWFDADVLESLAEFMETRHNVGLVMPKILNPDHTVQYHCRMLPTPLNLVARRFLPAFFYKNMNERYEMRFSGYDRLMEVPYANGSFMFFRGSVIDEIGGFDEKIFMYGEDLDLSRRIHERSKAVFLPHVSVYHRYHRESYKSLKLLYYHIKGVGHYFSKWGWFFDKRRKEINRKLFEDYR